MKEKIVATFETNDHIVRVAEVDGNRAIRLSDSRNNHDTPCLSARSAQELSEALASAAQVCMVKSLDVIQKELRDAIDRFPVGCFAMGPGAPMFCNEVMGYVIMGGDIHLLFKDENEPCGASPSILSSSGYVRKIKD